MSTVRRRRYVLAGLLVAVAVLAAAILREVLGTVFFAVTVAYVLLPLRRRLADRGLPPRAASAVATALAFVAVLLILLPVGITIYQRRAAVFALLQNFPTTISVEVLGVAYVVSTAAVLAAVRTGIEAVAVSTARAMPVLALKLVLFVMVVYGLLLRPAAAGRALFGVVPSAYHDVLVALHERIRDTLYAIYVLQAATAAGTFVVALVVFFALGYRSPLVLAVIAGVLQFIPIVGPGLLVAALAVLDFTAGNVPRALLVAVLGAVLIGLLPDAVIRTRLAERTADLPGSLYFVGFTGGVLTLGAIGFIVGPLAVAVVVEAVDLLSTDGARQARLED